MVDGRPELCAEIDSADSELKHYLVRSIETLLSDRAFVDAIPGCLPGDAANQARTGLIMSRLRAIAAMVA